MLTTRRHYTGTRRQTSASVAVGVDTELRDIVRFLFQRLLEIGVQFRFLLMMLSFCDLQASRHLVHKLFQSSVAPRFVVDAATWNSRK